MKVGDKIYGVQREWSKKNRLEVVAATITSVGQKQVKIAAERGAGGAFGYRTVVPLDHSMLQLTTPVLALAAFRDLAMKMAQHYRDQIAKENEAACEAEDLMREYIVVA